MSVEALAAELITALDGHTLIAPLTARDPGFDAETAYLVSAEVLRRRRARGERPVGRKIGFTNRTLWSTYGVWDPIWAHVYDTTVTQLDEPSGSLAIGPLVQPRIEPEIVFHFGSTPLVTEDEETILTSIDWMAHGYEIVQSHFPDWKFKAPDAIAAFGLHGALVVGPRVRVAGMTDVVRKLRTFTLTLAKHGLVEARGGGANVLDSPLLALAHLLLVLKSQPQFTPVQAGEIVTTGSLVSPPLVRAGETWSTELSGIELGGLRLLLNP